MTQLFVQMSVSLDGFIEDRSKGSEWLAGNDVFDQVRTSTRQRGLTHPRGFVLRRLLNNLQARGT